MRIPSLVSLLTGLACASAPRGFRQIASGGELTVVLEGAMTGTLTLASTPTAHLDGEVGLYDPQPPFPAPVNGAWIAERTVAEPSETAGVWQIDARTASSSGLRWAAGCGVPSADGMQPLNLMVFADDASATVILQVPLSNAGLASFEGTAIGMATLSSDLVAEGRWVLNWCDGSGGEVDAGPGTVRLRWEIDPATLRSWEAPRRGAS